MFLGNTLFSQKSGIELKKERTFRGPLFLEKTRSDSASVKNPFSRNFAKLIFGDSFRKNNLQDK